MAGEARRCGVRPVAAPESSHGLTSRGYGASFAGRLRIGGVFRGPKCDEFFLRSLGLKYLSVPNLPERKILGSRGSLDRGTFLERLLIFTGRRNPLPETRTEWQGKLDALG